MSPFFFNDYGKLFLEIKLFESTRGTQKIFEKEEILPDLQCGGEIITCLFLKISLLWELFVVLLCNYEFLWRFLKC